MLGLKKLDGYVIRNFLVLLCATFFITTFIIMMQYLWSHISVMVGKGIDMSILAELLFYATLALLPLAIPLAILMASLMTFGNMGGNLELLAMKTAGISLFRIMRAPMIVAISIAIGSFFFSNDIIPLAQTRMILLNYSIRQTSPELDIPEGEFYDQIPGMQIYVRHKNHDTGALNDVMLYDFSSGFNNASVTTADTAFVKLTVDKMNLRLILINGENFENLKDQSNNRKSNIPYRRETFAYKEILLDVDQNFKEMDKDLLNDSHVSKDITQLNYAIDSISVQADSARVDYGKILINSKFYNKAYSQKTNQTDTKLAVSRKPYSLNADSLFLKKSQAQMELYMQKVHAYIVSMKSNVRYYEAKIGDLDYHVIRNRMEWHKKMTLPFACLIFFFIGAPLGAIIKKGGLGMPVVISVMMFIIYYVISNMGEKLAREGIWPLIPGMWFSSFILLPIGIFLTYTAATDSPLFNKTAYLKRWDKIKKVTLNLIHIKPTNNK